MRTSLYQALFAWDRARKAPFYLRIAGGPTLALPLFRETERMVAFYESRGIPPPDIRQVVDVQAFVLWAQSEGVALLLDPRVEGAQMRYERVRLPLLPTS